MPTRPADWPAGQSAKHENWYYRWPYQASQHRWPGICSLLLWLLACISLLKLYQDMVRIVDKKGAHLALYIAAICQLSGNLYALGDQGVGHGLEIVNRKREVANTHRAIYSSL